MKRIVAINSSYRKKNTLYLIEQIQKLLPGVYFEIIHLKEYNIKPCSGCEHCITKTHCIIKDDAHLVIDKMKQADGIILATPVYLRNISGSLKVLIDRTCSWYHISDVIGKPLLGIATTASSGSQEVRNILDDLACQWGAIRAGFIYRTIRSLEKKPLREKEIKRFIFFLSDKNRKKYRPSFKEIKDYNLQKILAKKIIIKDNKIWGERGYYSQPYYYTCRINIVKRLYGFLLFKLLVTVIPDKNTE